MTWRFAQDSAPKNKGLLLHNNAYESPIVVEVTILNGNVQVGVKLGDVKRKGFLEDKRLADKIEELIKEAFKQYHQTKTKDSIDI